MRAPLAERFWAKVDKVDASGCWLWTAGKDAYGYGVFQAGPTIRGSHVGRAKAHRVAWELTNGPIPSGLGVLHRCDNPSCVNPSHLFVGTQAENMRDMDAKGRRVSTPTVGERNCNARLTTDAVRVIRFLREETCLSSSQIGTLFGVDRTTVRKIWRRLSWAHVEGSA